MVEGLLLCSRSRLLPQGTGRAKSGRPGISHLRVGNISARQPAFTFGNSGWQSGQNKL